MNTFLFFFSFFFGGWVWSKKLNLSIYLCLGDSMFCQLHDCKVSATNCSFNLIEPDAEGRAGDCVLCVGGGDLHGVVQGRAHHHGTLS